MQRVFGWIFDQLLTVIAQLVRRVRGSSRRVPGRRLQTEQEGFFTSPVEFAGVRLCYQTLSNF